MYVSIRSIRSIYVLSIAIKSADDFESSSQSDTNVALVFYVQMWRNSTERILLNSISCANLCRWKHEHSTYLHIQLILSVSVNFAQKHLHNLFILLVLAAAFPEF